MLNRIKTIIFLMLLFSCSNLEFSENASGISNAFNFIAAQVAGNLDRDKYYAAYVGMNNNIEEYNTVDNNTMNVYDEGGTRVELFRKMNKNNKKLLLVSNGGSFINPYKDNRRKFYAVTIGENLPDYDIMIVDLKMGYQHRFPSQNKDLMNGYKLALKLGYDNNNIAIIGDSSGGNIATSVVIYLNEHKLPMPGKLILMSPYLDASNKVESRIKNRKKDFLFGDPLNKNNKIKLEDAMPYFAAQKDLTNPYISPVYYKNLKDFPETLIQVSDYEILYNDSEDFYFNMVNADANVNLEIYAGQVHVFQFLSFPESKYALKKIFEFLNKENGAKKVSINKEILEKIKFDVNFDSLSEEEVYQRLLKSGIDLEDLINLERKNYKVNKRSYLNK